MRFTSGENTIQLSAFHRQLFATQNLASTPLPTVFNPVSHLSSPINTLKQQCDNLSVSFMLQSSVYKSASMLSPDFVYYSHQRVCQHTVLSPSLLVPMYI
jgi:hypothetical protein